MIKIVLLRQSRHTVSLRARASREVSTMVEFTNIDPGMHSEAM